MYSTCHDLALDLGAWAGHGHKKQDKMGQERTCKSRIDMEPRVPQPMRAGLDEHDAPAAIQC